MSQSPAELQEDIEESIRIAAYYVDDQAEAIRRVLPSHREILEGNFDPVKIAKLLKKTAKAFEDATKNYEQVCQQRVTFQTGESHAS